MRQSASASVLSAASLSDNDRDIIARAFNALAPLAGFVRGENEPPFRLETARDAAVVRATVETLLSRVENWQKERRAQILNDLAPAIKAYIDGRIRTQRAERDQLHAGASPALLAMLGDKVKAFDTVVINLPEFSHLFPEGTTYEQIGEVLSDMGYPVQGKRGRVAKGTSSESRYHVAFELGPRRPVASPASVPQSGSSAHAE